MKVWMSTLIIMLLQMIHHSIWGSVKSVRISLLLASDDFVTSTPRQVMFNGAAVNAGTGADRRLRMVYTTTISLRNSTP